MPNRTRSVGVSHDGSSCVSWLASPGRLEKALVAMRPFRVPIQRRWISFQLNRICQRHLVLGAGRLGGLPSIWSLMRRYVEDDVRFSPVMREYKFMSGVAVAPCRMMDTVTVTSVS